MTRSIDALLVVHPQEPPTFRDLESCARALRMGMRYRDVDYTMMGKYSRAGSTPPLQQASSPHLRPALRPSRESSNTKGAPTGRKTRALRFVQIATPACREQERLIVETSRPLSHLPCDPSVAGAMRRAGRPVRRSSSAPISATMGSITAPWSARSDPPKRRPSSAAI